MTATAAALFGNFVVGCGVLVVPGMLDLLALDLAISIPQAGSLLSLASMDEMGSVGRIDAMQGSESPWHPLSELSEADNTDPLQPPMVTLQIVGGRKEKIRPGDVLGALTKDLGFAGSQIGKINVNEFSTYVAVERSVADAVLRGLNAGKVKGKSVKVRRL